MNNISKLAMIGALTAFGLAQTNAQDSTNVLADVTIKGTVYVQSSDTDVTTRRVTNKDVLNLLATDLGITLKKNSKIVASMPVGTGQIVQPTLILQNGSTNDTTDLSDN